MRVTTHIGRVCVGLAVSGLITAVVSAQSGVVENAGPLSGPPPLNAPFSADATTTVANLFEIPADYTLWTVVSHDDPLMRFTPPEGRHAQAR